MVFVRKIGGSLAVAYGVIRGVLDVVFWALGKTGDVDLVIERLNDPGWIKDVYGWVMEPHAIVPLLVMVVGFVLLLWPRIQQRVPVSWFRENQEETLEVTESSIESTDRVGSASAEPIAFGPDMDMCDAVSLAAGTEPSVLGDDLDRLHDILTEIRQLAYQGEIQVWGREVTDHDGASFSDIWTTIPRSYWVTKEFLPVVIDGSYIGAHTIVDAAFSQKTDVKPAYTSTRVNREQFERAVAKDDPESLGAVLRRYLDEGWELFNRVGKRRPDFRIVNLDGQTQNDITKWNRKVGAILEDSGMHKAKRDFAYYKLETTGELRVRVSRLQQILTNEIEKS